MQSDSLFGDLTSVVSALKRVKEQICDNVRAQTEPFTKRSDELQMQALGIQASIRDVESVIASNKLQECNIKVFQLICLLFYENCRRNGVSWTIRCV